MIDYNILNKLSEPELRNLVMRYSNEMDAMSELIRVLENRIADLKHVNDSLQDLFRCMTARVNCHRETLDFTHELLSKYSQTVNTCEDATEDKETKDDRI